jgi:hypothetical protein
MQKKNKNKKFVYPESNIFHVKKNIDTFYLYSKFKLFSMIILIFFSQILLKGEYLCLGNRLNMVSPGDG